MIYLSIRHVMQQVLLTFVFERSGKSGAGAVDGPRRTEANSDHVRVTNCCV